MENQYNYYTTDQNMDTGNYGDGGEPGKEPQKKRGKGAARWAKVVCAGLVFGVVASAAFQTSNIVAGKVLVSAKDRTMDSYDGKLLQTDAAINPGNSGGALLNANGEVIGINSAKIATETVEGIGYAIPVSDVSDLITNLMNQKTKTKVAESERGYIGIKGVDVTSDSAQMYNMPTGVYVSEVISGGGAEKAGITKGAVITGIEGTSVNGMDALQEQLQYYKAGEKVKITIQIQNKNGEYEKKDDEVTLGKQSE